MESLFKLARELAPPAVWSAGVALARNGEFQEDASAASDERTFVVFQGPRERALTVTLSEPNELWQCSCGSDDDPCKHVVGVILAVRQGALTKPSVRSVTASIGRVIHRFSRRGDLLSFERLLQCGGENIPVEGTLIGAVAREQKAGRHYLVTDEDGAIDYVLPTKKSGVFDPKTMGFLLAALSRVQRVELDGDLVRVSAVKHKAHVEVLDEPGGGFRLRRITSHEGSEVFRNGVGYQDGELFTIDDSTLTSTEYELISGAGTFFPDDRAIELATIILPTLDSKVSLSVRSLRLPRARVMAPRVYVEVTEEGNSGDLLAVPHLVYGDPPVAEVSGDMLKLESRRDAPIRQKGEEGRLIREVTLKLGLKFGEAKVFRGEEAARFGERLRGWSVVSKGGVATRSASTLIPHVAANGSILSLSFESSDGTGSIGLAEALSAAKTGATFVRVRGQGEGAMGSWASLPVQWLQEHSDALERLLDGMRERGSAPAYLLPEVEEICASLSVSPPDYYGKLREALSAVETIPTSPLPADLTTTLRPYQVVGVTWLRFLREQGLSGLLADDMGLGKTLQALCAVEGRTLVVAPASVIHTWRAQAERFRPALKVSVYHGPSRSLESDADLTITTYAVARLDVEKLQEVTWNTLVLDEAQTIRNPDSLVACAIRSIKSDFTISLSGTPIENSLQDLWSHFAVLLPGYLGSRSEFSEIAKRIESGDTTEALRVRNRVRPFILRRFKRDVAKELPPKTEVTLYADLSPHERTAYEAILGATRSELLEKLGDKVDIFSLLEALLRLRQACCHLALVPGYSAQSSSKLDILLESLEASIQQGHRALIFSQWTSLLDLVEPKLTARGVSFSRIDGSTTNRQEITDAFQRSDGPSVMLLSLKAGGLGLTLTAADHVYILDPWWNPAVEDQAADRVYRIGQENPVLVHRLVARDTIEERVLDLQRAKRQVAEAIVGDEGSRAAPVSKEELLKLLSPS